MMVVVEIMKNEQNWADFYISGFELSFLFQLLGNFLEAKAYKT